MVALGSEVLLTTRLRHTSPHGPMCLAPCQAGMCALLSPDTSVPRRPRRPSARPCSRPHWPHCGPAQVQRPRPRTSGRRHMCSDALSRAPWPAFLSCLPGSLHAAPVRPGDQSRHLLRPRRSSPAGRPAPAAPPRPRSTPTFFAGSTPPSPPARVLAGLHKVRSLARARRRPAHPRVQGAGRE